MVKPAPEIPEVSFGFSGLARSNSISHLPIETVKSSTGMCISLSALFALIKICHTQVNNKTIKYRHLKQ